jgi:putative nucleotidyltransferase with HDIG domain
MSPRLRSILGWGGLVCLAGASLGIGAVKVSSQDVVLEVALLATAIAGEWLEVQMGAVGVFTLRPVIAFVALWTADLSLFMLCGLLPILLVGMLVKRQPVLEALGAVGRESVSLWIGYLTYAGLSASVRPQLDSSLITDYSIRLGSLVAYWLVRIPLQALERHQSEGIRYSVALATLVRRLSPHAIVLTLVAVFLNYVLSGFGVLLMVLAGVVLIEAYYPSKLLGEQGGVLLTSLQMMAQAVDLKDPYTSNHSQRVSRYAVRIARAMGLPEEEVERVRVGGLMHDIGKIGISGSIIRKPGKLTQEERILMMRHSSVSADIIQSIEILGESAEMVRHHHEHCDGAGYPDGLTRENIPVGSRIILVSDAFDALTTDRPYRKGASKADAIAVIQSNTGTQFDPDAVEALVRVVDAF